MTIILYQRISTEKQNFDEQERMLEKYRESCNERCVLLSEIRSSQEVGDSKLIKFLNDPARYRSVSKIMVIRIDRLARNLKSGLVLWDLFRKRKIELDILQIKNWNLLSRQEKYLLYIYTLHIKELQYIRINNARQKK